MCGICGIFHLDNREIDVQNFEEFTSSLEHRGPDGKGFYYNSNKNLGLGHTRLKILDLSILSDQPMKDISSRYTITYNGEIYNYLEIKNELLKKGYKFRSKGDTEVVLNAFLEWGTDCDLKFNGMWAYAIWDNKLKKLFLSRDRFGVKPLYYYLNNHIFVFSSELKSFTKIKNYRPEINTKRFSSMHKDFNREDTFLKNVFLLGPGYTLEIDKNKNFKKRKWWRTINHISKLSKNYHNNIEEFREIFLSACKLRLRSDVELSTSLSGGLDSTSIVCGIDYLTKNIQSFRGKFHNSFILNYVNERNSETKYAKKVIKATNSNEHIVNLEKKNLDIQEFVEATYYQEMITGDDGIGPWTIYKNMKEKGIKVSLDGHGPDELLGGYSDDPLIFSKTLLWKDIKKKFELKLLQLKMTSDNNYTKSFLKKIINKLIKKKIDTKKTNYFYSYDEDPKYFDRDETENLDKFNQYLYESFHYLGLPKILLKFDKLSMAHGIESRCPFLDWRLVTFLFSLPSHRKINKQYTKVILRDSMKNINPKEINYRTIKKGFVSEKEWFIENYRDFFGDIIMSRDFLEVDFFDGKSILKDFERGNIDIKNLFLYFQAYVLNKKFK